MMEEPLVSIIMPVYNTPLLHVERAVKSVIDQTYKNIELLVVIDGCDEEYCSQIRAICESDSRIRVHRIEHAGVSAARNYGIEHASGDYIMFMDSDDEMVDVCVKHALGAASEYDLDIVCGALEYVYAGTVRTSQLEFDGSSTMILSDDKTDSLAKYYFTYEVISNLADVRFVPRGPVAKLYSKRIMDVRFNTEISLSEDGVFNALASKKAKRIGLVGEIWYIYNMNSFSASKAQALDERFESHAGELRKIAIENGFEVEDYRAHVRRFFIDSIEREAFRGDKGRYRRIIMYLHEPFIMEAFADADELRFDISKKRRFSYWLCRKKLAFPLYLFYSTRVRKQKRHGESLQ